MTPINLYNIDTEAVAFLRQVWKLDDYAEVLSLIQTQRRERRSISHWLVHVAATGGDDITDVTQARELLRQYAS